MIRRSLAKPRDLCPGWVLRPGALFPQPPANVSQTLVQGLLQAELCPPKMQIC